MDSTSPLTLVGAALMVGAGLYVIQRGRIIFPYLFDKVPFLHNNRRASGFLFLLCLTLSVVMAGFGCRILYHYFT